MINEITKILECSNAPVAMIESIRNTLVRFEKNRRRFVSSYNPDLRKLPNTMSKEEFEKQFNKLIKKHGFFWKHSTDFFPLADLLIYKNESDESPALVIGLHSDCDREAGIAGLKKIFETTNT
jgi:hypothetical protein